MQAQESARGRVVIFRPDQNAARLKAGAARMSMPSVPEDQFVEAVRSTVAANLDYVSRDHSTRRPRAAQTARRAPAGQDTAAQQTQHPRRRRVAVLRPASTELLLHVAPPSGAAHGQGLALPAAAAAGYGSHPGPGPRAHVHLHHLRGCRGRLLQGRPAHAHRPNRGGALPSRRARGHGRHQGRGQLLAGAGVGAGGDWCVVRMGGKEGRRKEGQGRWEGGWALGRTARA
jgi:hypothetical protein